MPLHNEIEQRFGVLPNFFRLAGDTPEVTQNLWGFAKFAYLDSPLPSLFKERLFVYLSRFCEVRYCIARHIGFLVGLGYPAGDRNCLPQTVEQVLPLLQRPLPRGEELEPAIALCASFDPNSFDYPSPDTSEEEAIFACATHVFLQSPDAPRAIAALRQGLGAARLESLNVFLAFVRMAHYWTQIHPELRCEDDINHLLATHEALANCLLNDPEVKDNALNQQVLAELAELRQLKAEHESLQQAYETVSRENKQLPIERQRHQQSESQLSETQRRLELSLSGANLGIWTYSVSTDEFWADDRAKQMHGHAPHEVHTFAEAGVNIHPEDRDRAQAAFFQAIQNHAKLQLEYRVIWSDGSIHGVASYAEFRSTGSDSQGGSASQADEGMFYGIVQDISDRLQVESDRNRAEAALRESEAQFRNVADNAPLTVWVTDTTGYCTYLSRSWYDFTGQTEATGLGFKWLDATHPDDRESAQAIFLAANDRQEAFQLEYRLRHHDGHYRTCLDAAKPWFGVDGEFKGYIGSVIDIDDRKRAEEISRQAAALNGFRVSLADALRPLANPVEIQATASRVVGEYLAANRVAYFEVRGADYVVEQDYVNGADALAGRYPIDSFGPRLLAAYRTGRAVSSPNVAADPYLSPEQQSAYDAIQIAAYIGIPLVKEGEFVAGLTVHAATPRNWTLEEVALTQEVAEQTWAAVERARAGAALRVSEEKYRTLFESIDQGFCLLEVLFDANDKAYDYRYLEINEAFEQQSGLTNAVGKTILELVPNLEPQWGECYEQVVKLREAVRFEADVPSMNRVFDIYAVPSGAPGQNLVSVLFTDITDRKRREVNLVFLAEVQDDCARLTTAEAMMQTIGAKIGAYLNLAMCAFVDIDEAQDQAIVPYVWHRADVPNLAGTYRISDFVSEEFYIAARAGKVAVVNDTNTDTRTDAESCAALKIQSFIHVPFLRDGQWRFLFNVYDSHPREWREDEINLFYELANRIFPRLERTRAEAALRESEELKQRILESSKDCIKVLTLNSEIVYINTGGLRLLEVNNPTFVLNACWLDFWQGENYEIAKTAIAAAKVGNTGQFQGYLPTHLGTPKWWDIIISPVRNSAGQVAQLLVVSRDITKQKQAETEREQLLQREQTARETAENANRIKDEFLAVLSHELRSPLNPILGWSKLLQQRRLDAEKTATALMTIERNAQLQVQLIDDLLDVSRILRGKLSLTIMPVDLSTVTTAALETVRLAAEAKAIQIQTVVSPGVGMVMGDAGRLQQVVWNLLSNAVKFTPRGGQVTVDLASGKDQAQIQVTDTGKGINPDFLPYVFEHFRQEDGATTRKFGGLGLGLAIARQITEMHGGQIRVASPGEGAGATFTVQIPLASRPHPIAPAVKQPSSSIGDLSGLRILVVDDEADSREFVAFVLEQAGAIVTSVASGIDALQTFSQFVPNLIVSDVGMPEIDGYMLLRQIRSLPLEQGGRIPAIALTAYAGEIDQQQAIAAGFQRHLAKPIEPDQLTFAVASLAGHARNH